MLILLFFLFSFFTVFLSIKLSIYADNYSKNSKITSALMGGIILAGITSLPEFVTCFSAIFLKNNNLAVGDIFGSNLFNIFMMCVFDFLFIKKMIFNKANNHMFIYIYLNIIYFFILVYLNYSLKINILFCGMPSIVIFILYVVYILSLPKSNSIDFSFIKPIKHIKIKFFLTVFLMIIFSICLTFIVNSIAIRFPSFSSSLIGAILLGITTSLPEVVSFYTLIVIDNYDMAVDDILGSNLFNLFVFAVGDLFLKTDSLYSFFDNKSVIILFLCFVFNILNMISCFRRNVKNKFVYLIPSICIILFYLYFWFYSFIL